MNVHQTTVHADETKFTTNLMTNIITKGDTAKELGTRQESHATAFTFTPKGDFVTIGTTNGGRALSVTVVGECWSQVIVV